MHLLLDIAFNGKLLPKNIFAFYSFAYRAAHGFNGAALHGHRERIVPGRFWQAFFKGASSADRRRADGRTPARGARARG